MHFLMPNAILDSLFIQAKDKQYALVSAPNLEMLAERPPLPPHGFSSNNTNNISNMLHLQKHDQIYAYI